MMIEVKNQQKKVKIVPTKIIKIAKKILANEGVRKVQLSIVFVTDRKIKSINKKFLNKDRTTDVISFDLTDNVLSRSSRKIRNLEGEVIISATTAFYNAKRFKTSVEHEIALYVVHGILHLLGYDDHGASATKRMRKKEKEIMEKFFH